MPNYRTFGALEEGYLRDHPEEMDEYLTILFDEYAQSGDTAALLRTVQIDNLRQQLQGVDPTVVSPAAISITANQGECSCQGRTAHTG